MNFDYKQLIGLLKYKPKKYTEFELLEGKDEGVDRGNIPEASNIEPDAKQPKADDAQARQNGNTQSKPGNKQAQPGNNAQPKSEITHPQSNNNAQQKTDGKQAQPSNNALPKPESTQAQPGNYSLPESDSAQTQPGNRTHKRKEKKQSGTGKEPLTVDEWNKQKKEENVNNRLDQGLVSSDINLTLEKISQDFGIPYNADMIIRHLKIAGKTSSFLIYVDGMVDRHFISNFIIRQLMTASNFDEFFQEGESEDILDFVSDNVISAIELEKKQDLKSIYLQVLSGETALFVDGNESCLIISTRGYEKRSVNKPLTENVVLGSQEGFTENLRTNLSLVRRIIRNRTLITEFIRIGKTNQSNCAIMYMNGIVNQEVVKEVKRRIGGIDSDFIMGEGMLGQFLEDNPFSLLPQILTTERPDRVASFLVAGKVAIITDGTPFAQIVPVTFYHFMQTSEDSMLRWQYGTFLRIVRLLGLLVTSLLPGMYIALTLYHQEMIPTELLASIATAKENVPFPTIVEVLLLEISFELIREGGIRIPGVIGQTLGIIGALILGQAAVAAGLVSPVLIIIVSVTGLGSFAIPNYSMGIGMRILRFFFIFMAVILGFYGVSLGLYLILIFTCSMKSFGVPFFSPVGPKAKSSPDLLVREPIWRQDERPDYLNSPIRKQQGHISRKWKMKKPGDRNSW